MPTSSPHTLFQPGTWSASGYYLDQNRERIDVTGTFAVIHEAEVWLTRSRLTLHGTAPRAYANDGWVVPFPKGQNVTSWRGDHTSFGELRGTFTLVEDSVLSSFSSREGRYAGTEYLLRVLEGEYSSRGAVLQAGVRVASWRVELVKM